MTETLLFKKTEKSFSKLSSNLILHVAISGVTTKC